LERNNDYQRGFLFACERNTLGAIRFDLRMDAGEYVPVKGKAPKWTPDRTANTQIETAWAEWGKRGTCTVCGRFSWQDVKRLVVRGTPRDGNFIARKIRGTAAGNKFNFALQLWEVDHLDLEKFEVLKGGGEIRFGVETNALKRPVAFWLKVANPGDYGTLIRGTQTIRFPADEIYHVFQSERAEQTIGVPWMVSAITRLRQLGAFEEAATVAARLGASKAGFFKRTPGANGEVGEFTGGMSAGGAPQMEVSPGSFEALPDGWQLDAWNPEYPNIETGDFRKAMLRGVATSVGMSYTTLGNDLESVNFSSARVGLFEEREMWKALQAWYAEIFFEPVFTDWLESSILSGSINLPIGTFAKFNRPIFKARRWPFIDPLKEVTAAKDAVALRIASRQQYIEEAGGDRDDVFLDNLNDETYAEEIGLSLQPADIQPEAFGNLADLTAKPKGGPDDDDEEEDEDDFPTIGKSASKSAKGQPIKTEAPKAPSARKVLEDRVSALESKGNAQQAPFVVQPVVNVTNHIPEQREQVAPVVNVTVPPGERQEAPQVTVNVPQGPAPVVNVSVPDQPAPVVNVTNNIPQLEATLTINRDKDGLIAGGEIS
jgi:lambda family phage portal protein